MSRSKLRQKEQIANSQVYNDAYAGAHTGAVAQPAHPSESIELDLNIVRTQLKQLKGTASWFDETVSPLSGLQEELDTTQSSLGDMIDGSGAWVGFGPGTALLDSVLDAYGAVMSLDDGYKSNAATNVLNAASIASLDVNAGAGLTESGSLQAGTLAFDVVGTAGQITVEADSIRIADAFSKLDFTSVEVQSGTVDISASSDLNIESLAGNVNVSASTALNMYSTGDVNVSTQSTLNMDSASVTMDASGTISIDAAGESNLSTSSGSMTVSATFGDVNISAQSTLNMDSASVAMDASGTISINAGATSNLSTSYGDLTVSAAAGAVNISASSTLDMDAGLVTIDASGGGVSIDAAGESNLSTSSGNVTVSAATGDVNLQSSGVKVTSMSQLVITGNDKLQYVDGSETDGSYLRSDVSGNASWSQIIDNEVTTSFSGTNYLDGDVNVEEALLDLDSAIAATSLQKAYDNGSPAGVDILVDNDDVLNFVLGTGASAFTVTANAASGSNPVMRVDNDEIRFTSGGATVPTVVIADGYVLIDGYLSVTGSTLQINTEVTDADHYLISPALSSTPALIVKPEVTSALYTANLMEMWTGSDAVVAAIKINDDGKMVIDASGNLQLAGHNAADGYYARSDASGNVSWASVSDQLAGDGLSSTGTVLNVNVVPGETIIDGDAVGIDEAFSKLNFTSVEVQSSGAVTIGSADAVSVTAPALNMTAGSSLSIGVSDTFTATNIGMSSTDVYITGVNLNVNADDAVNVNGAHLNVNVSGDVNASGTDLNVNVSGDVNVNGTYLNVNVGSDVNVSSTNLSMSAYNSVNVNAAYSVNIDAGADSHLNTSSGSMTLSAEVGDVYVSSYGGEIRLADARSAATGGLNNSFRLSTSAVDFNASVRASAGVSAGVELGIIDAINALASSSGSNAEKAVYIVGGGAVLADSNKSLELATAQRGSLELTGNPADGYSSMFYPGRDFEVFVNGQLMLPDVSQKAQGASATDDYFLATNHTHVTFNFALVSGDVVVVKNAKAAPGEDIDSGWDLIV